MLEAERRSALEAGMDEEHATKDMLDVPLCIANIVLRHCESKIAPVQAMAALLHVHICTSSRHVHGPPEALPPDPSARSHSVLYTMQASQIHCTYRASSSFPGSRCWQVHRLVTPKALTEP